MHVVLPRSRSIWEVTACVWRSSWTEPLPLEHVHEVHVAANVELHGAVEDAAVLEELCQHAMCDRCADLRLDVVAEDGDAGLLEPLCPFRRPGDEHRQRVDERHAGIDRALRVELRRPLRADRR